MQVRSSQTATLAGGCFWCLEAVFEQVDGIENVVSGYTGGHLPNPSYQQVCSETTGHAEAVQLTFYHQSITFEEILEIFFDIHDPTTLNRQGNDIGTSYRSSIFCHNSEQRTIAETTVADLDLRLDYNSPIVTEVVDLTVFYPAEDYHQEYYQNNITQPYCQVVISPKLSKFQQNHANRVKRNSSRPIP